MTKFKVGDKVKIVKKETPELSNFSGLSVGESFIVEEISSEKGYPNYYRRTKGTINGVAEELLELAPQFENLVISCPTEQECEEVRQELLRRGYSGTCNIEGLYRDYSGEVGFSWHCDSEGNTGFSFSEFNWYKEEEEYNTHKFLSASEFLGNCTTCQKNDTPIPYFNTVKRLGQNRHYGR